MIIQYIGHDFFKISTKDTIIATDPFPKELGLEPVKFKADILTISHPHWDHNNKKAILGNPFIIEKPGEYEVKNIFIRGIRSFHDASHGKERGINTMFLFNIENIKIAHLGDYGQKDLTTEQLELLEEVDILFIPIGGTYTIGSKEASQLILKIEPKIVIPMHYKTPSLKIKDIEPLETFLKEMGQENIAPEEKLTVKEKDLPEETKIITLKPLAKPLKN